MKRLAVQCLAVVYLVTFALVGSSNASVLLANQDANITSGANADAVITMPYLTVNWSWGAKNVGLVQFDTSSISAGSVASSVLRIYHMYNSGNGADFAIYRNTSAWSAGSVTWNTAPSYAATPVANMVIGDSNSGVWREIDVTSVVQGWTDGIYGNFGLRIERVGQENPYVYLAATSSGYAPELRTAITPVPAAVWLLGTGLAGILGLGARARKNRHSA